MVRILVSVGSSKMISKIIFLYRFYLVTFIMVFKESGNILTTNNSSKDTMNSPRLKVFNQETATTLIPNSSLTSKQL